MSRKFNTKKFIRDMNQHISQDEIKRIIISDMVKKRGSIVPVIGEDTIVYKNSALPAKCVYHIFSQAKDDSEEDLQWKEIYVYLLFD